MTSPPSHSTAAAMTFPSQNHLNPASTSLFTGQPSGSVIRSQVLGLERLGLPDGLHGTPSQQGSSSSSAGPQLQGKMKAHPHGKKTKGRVKIKMEFIDNKLRRYTTFSKRKAGLMKKAYELSTLTGTEVMLLVASETGHVYTFATRKLQPMIASEDGKKLIQTCLNSNLPNGSDEVGLDSEPIEHRMNLGTGYEEEAGDDEDEYFDSNGDSSNGGSPPPANARFHNPASSSPQVDTTNSAAAQAQYADYLASTEYYSTGMYNPELKAAHSCNGQSDAVLNSYDAENHAGNFSSTPDSARR